MHFPFALSSLSTVHGSCIFIFRPLFFQILPALLVARNCITFFIVRSLFRCLMRSSFALSSLSTVHGSCIFTFQPLFQILLRSSWPAIVSHFPFLLLFSDVSCAPRGPQIPPPFLLSLHISCIFIARSFSGLSHSPRAPHFHYPHPHQHTHHHLSFN